jgi:hypothetical protein
MSLKKRGRSNIPSSNIQQDKKQKNNVDTADFEVDVDNENIVFKINGIKQTGKKINITSLLSNEGSTISSSDNFEKNQQEINFLDSIKDGTKKFILNQLNIFPESGDPSYPKRLFDIKSNILKSKKMFLTYNSWLKVSKDSVLTPAKFYQNIFYESGLKHYAYVKDPNDVNTINTFGSYIDPLDKGPAKSVWPEPGKSIHLTENFMKLMGYGESSIFSTTRTKEYFNYEMKIKCGECANKYTNCILNGNGFAGKPDEFFFSGNNEKSKFLTESGNASGKNIFVVLKGWGDKVQVLIFFIYYHLINPSSVITTLDLVVFTLCMILSIPCIYVGEHDPPNIPKDDKSKYRSIIEYKPSNNPYEDMYAYTTNELDKIYKENTKFIGTIEYLVANPGINIGEYKFEQKFYEAILEDIQKIQEIFSEEKDDFFEKYKPMKKTKSGVSKKYKSTKSSKPLSNRKTKKIVVKVVKNDITKLQEEFKQIKQKYLLVPFIKIKKGTKDKLVILMTKSYTAQKPCDNTKPSIQTYLLNTLNKNTDIRTSSFLDIGLKYFNMNNINITGGLKVQYNKFHKDEVDYYNTYFGQTEIDYTNNANIFYSARRSMKYDEYFTDEENKDNNFNVTGNTYKINLLKELTKSFNETINKYATYIKTETQTKIHNNFPDTIYTLFVYESYLNGYCSIQFNEDILINIINEYQLVPVVSDIQEEPISNSNNSNMIVDNSEKSTSNSSMMVVEENYNSNISKMSQEKTPEKKTYSPSQNTIEPKTKKSNVFFKKIIS